MYIHKNKINELQIIKCHKSEKKGAIDSFLTESGQELSRAGLLRMMKADPYMNVITIPEEPNVPCGQVVLIKGDVLRTVCDTYTANNLLSILVDDKW